MPVDTPPGCPRPAARSNVDALKRDLAHLDAWGLPFILLWSCGEAPLQGGHADS